MKKILVCTQNETGFKQYTTDLHLESTHTLEKNPELFPFTFLDPLFFEPLHNNACTQTLALKIKEKNPDLVHFHHEYGFLGSKKPLSYQFPKLIENLKQHLPQLKISATAHTVIPEDFQYPIQGRGLQIPFRMLANFALRPYLLNLWNTKTWGALDGVTAHSLLQKNTLVHSRCPIVEIIPHYIPPPHLNPPESAHSRAPLSLKLHQALLKTKDPIVFVFGYFTPEKGQDIAIEAFRFLKTNAHLILAGGIRRKEDENYFLECQEKIKKYSLEEKISITGFIEFQDLDLLCQKAALALIPFRTTSGSGSLADLFTRSMPTLASYLPINHEIDQRVPGCLSFFNSENPHDCAMIIENLLAHPEYLESQKNKIQEYAQKYSAHNCAQAYLGFFKKVLLIP